MKKVLLLLLVAGIVAGCSVGHEDYVNFRNKLVGTQETSTEPYKWPDSGQLIRSDYLLSGQGLTHISKNAQGDLIYHYDVQEVLPNYRRKEWVGKCLIYNVVDPVTRIIKDWGFDEGGNPLSCRTWP